jgi:hypothetical protein
MKTTLPAAHYHVFRVERNVHFKGLILHEILNFFYKTDALICCFCHFLGVEWHPPPIQSVSQSAYHGRRQRRSFGS